MPIGPWLNYWSRGPIRNSGYCSTNVTMSEEQQTSTPSANESFADFAARVLYEKHDTLKAIYDTLEEFIVLPDTKKKKVLSKWSGVPLEEKPPIGFRWEPYSDKEKREIEEQSSKEHETPKEHIGS